MTDKKRKPKLPRAELKAPRLYIGDADAEIEIHELAIGEVGASTFGDQQKPRPNEDSAAILPVDDTHLVLVVADGVGGLGGARRASNITVKAIRDALATVGKEPGRGLRTAIMDGIETANRSVMESANGAASTLALAEIGPDYVRTYHVGDSVLMLCGQRGRIKLQSTPHSPVGFALEAGLLNEKEALHHDELNLIFNVIGSADMSIEVGTEQPIARYDTLLLASDGLTDNLMQSEIVDVIRTGSMEKALRNLTDLALDRMSNKRPGKPSKPDDFTVLIYRGRRRK